MILENQFLKSSPFEFVPITKTPWGGYQIAQLKKKYFPEYAKTIPERVGESLEIHVDSLLLKWIEALEPLSVQVHPKHTSPLLKSHECGKQEAWYVYSLANPSPLYLGFKEGYSKEDIGRCLQSDTPLDCVHSFLPQKNSYISIPFGCVHALGSGIFVAEPQHVLPRKDGKTLRMFDWNRLYNAKGERDKTGKPREMHFEDALNSIDWDLPQGKNIEKTLVKQFNHCEKFVGNHYNPFSIQTFLKEGLFHFEGFEESKFCVMTVLSGKVVISMDKETINAHGGESICLPKTKSSYKLEITQMFDTDPCVLLFALNQKYT